MLNSRSAWTALTSLATLTVELVLDDVEQTAVKTFNKMKGFHVKITDALFLLASEVRCRLRLDFRVHDDCLTVLFGGVGFLPALRQTLSNTNKILLKP